MSEKTNIKTTAEPTATKTEPGLFFEDSAEGIFSGFVLSPVSEFGDTFLYWFDDISNDPQDIENFRFVEALSSEPQSVVQSFDPDYSIGLFVGDDHTPFGANETFGDLGDDHALGNTGPGVIIEWESFDPKLALAAAPAPDAPAGAALADFGLLA